MTTGFKTYDVIVVGGGTAGMAAAISSAQRGLKVLVFDAAGPEFDKPCGEGLMSPAVRALKILQVEIPEAHPIDGVLYYFSDHSVEATFKEPSTAIGVRRRTLRKAMWSRASRLGIEIRVQKVSEIIEEESGYRVNGSHGSYVCVATGSREKILKSLGLKYKEKKVCKSRRRMGLRRHIAMSPWSQFVEVHWHDHCELYVTPVSANCVNIAILSWEPLPFEKALDNFPAIKQRISGYAWDDDVGGRYPLYHRASRVRKGRILVLGDAAFFLDAMTGEGNTLALNSGIFAARSIARGLPFIYNFYWFFVVWRYVLVTAPLLWATKSPQRRHTMLRCLKRLPWTMKLGLRFLAR